MPNPSKIVCAGCGFEVAADEPYPFRCPQVLVDDNIDHVLRRHLDPGIFASAGEAKRLFAANEENPFLKYRQLFHGYLVAISAGLDDESYVEWVRELDDRIATVDGHGFGVTPFAPEDELAATMNIEPGNLWLKNETTNVSGSHKARHLMGVMLWLEVARRIFPGATELAWRLAIASCGNAALAAAVVARAAGQPLKVYVPPSAKASVLARLESLGSDLNTCRRDESSPPGDPCVHHFRQAVEQGAIPFTCQGSENGMVIEGGKTLAWEMISELLSQTRSLDRLFLQVGGGALASSCIQAFQEARDIGLVERLPAIYTVQTQSASPLYRAWDQVMDRILLRHHRETNQSSPHLGDDAERALFASDEVQPALVREELAYAATHRSEFMWAWEDEPHSIAGGILDDETYDWLVSVEAMILTGGYPVVVAEETLQDAQLRIRKHTSISADATGTSGLAGLIAVQSRDPIGEAETVAVLVTGVER